MSEISLEAMMRAVWDIYPEADCYQYSDILTYKIKNGIIDRARTVNPELSALCDSAEEAWADAYAKLSKPSDMPEDYEMDDQGNMYKSAPIDVLPPLTITFTEAMKDNDGLRWQAALDERERQLLALLKRVAELEARCNLNIADSAELWSEELDKRFKLEAKNAELEAKLELKRGA